MCHRRLLDDEWDKIESLISRKTKLLQELSDVDQQLLAARARHSKLSNSTTPAYRLPDELLIDIFFLCQEACDRSTPPFEVIVSHVTARWREVALGASLLWNNIRLFLPEDASDRRHERALQRLSVYLNRSAGRLLNIYLGIGKPNTVPRFLHALTPHAERWQLISISVPKGLHEASLYTPLRSISTPNLVHFSLRIGMEEDPDSPRTEYPAVCLEILSQGCPSLAFVRVAGTVVGRFAPQYRTISTLHIDAWPKNIMSHSQFRTMLGTLQNLVNLSLTGLCIQLPRDPLVALDPIPMCNLRSLRIRGNATPCHRLLALMKLPALQSLSLLSVDTFDSCPIPTLHTLLLELCSFSDTELANIVRAFPSVVSLSIDNSTPEIYTILDPDATPLHWPTLEEMFQRGLPPSDVVPFCILIFGRLKMPKPLRRLYLDRRSRTVLRSKGHHLEVLEKCLDVQKCDHLGGWPADLGYDDPDDVWRY